MPVNLKTMNNHSRRRFINTIVGGGIGSLASCSFPSKNAEVKMIESKLPVISEVDICVLGGSCTGVFAAVRASRLGSKVAIVE
jgi:hypothetical protein